MAYSRFTLDTSQLDDATVGLDGSPFPMNATAASSLGGTSATASATVKVHATVASSLDGTSATASATVKVPATATSSLDGTSATASATVKVPATAASLLGGLVGSASSTPQVFVVASSSLGGIDASATSVDIKSAIFGAVLGNVVGSATAAINPPEPDVVPTSGSPWRKQPATPVKKHKTLEPIIVEMPEPRLPVLVSALVGSRLGGANITALGSITFSTLDDDAEVLLVI